MTTDITPDDFGEITGTADIIDQFPDATDDYITVGVHEVSGVVLIGVRASPAILNAEGRDRFMKAWAAAEFAIDRAAMPGQPEACAYCEDDPGHPEPDNPGSCTCASPGCGLGWCPERDALAELGIAATPGQVPGE